MLSIIKFLAAAALRLSTPAVAKVTALPIPLCEDVEEIDTNLLASPGTRERYNRGRGAPGPLIDFLDTYAKEHPDTYAGEWFSSEWGGTFVVAFTDDPKPHLEAIHRRRPRTTDWTVDVVQTAHSYSELKALEDSIWRVPGSLPAQMMQSAKLLYYKAKLRACPPDAPDAAKYQAKVDKYRSLLAAFYKYRTAGGDPKLRPKICSSGRNPQTSRVEVVLCGHPTVEDVAAMARTLTDEAHGKICIGGRLWDESMPTLDDRLNVRFAPMADAGADPLVECQGSLAPLSAFTGEPDVPAGSDDPLHILLRSTEALPPTFTAGPAEGWRTLARDGKRATFYWTDGDEYRVRTYRMTRAGWFAGGESSGVGECGRGGQFAGFRLALPEGLRTVEMRLDPRNPPNPDSTTLHLLVEQDGCAGGRSGVERMPKPEVFESATEIRLAMGVIPPDGGGFWTCTGNAADPITIELAAPIGRRTIVDGLALPPRPLSPRKLSLPSGEFGRFRGPF